jgi:hypothetical protein
MIPVDWRLGRTPTFDESTLDHHPQTQRRAERRKEEGFVGEAENDESGGEGEEEDEKPFEVGLVARSAVKDWDGGGEDWKREVRHRGFSQAWTDEGVLRIPHPETWLTRGRPCLSCRLRAELQVTTMDAAVKKS